MRFSLSNTKFMGMVYCIVYLLENNGTGGDKFEFMKDFFENKKVQLTVCTCNTQDSLKLFLSKLIKSNDFLGINIYGNSLDKLENVFHHISVRNWFVIDIQSCGRLPEIVSFMNRTDLFRHPLKHLFLVNLSDQDIILKYICNCRILVASEVYVAYINGFDIDLYEIYKIRPSSECMNVHYGNWSKNKGIIYDFPHSPITQRRQNFQQHELVVSVVINNNKSLTADFDYLSEATVDEPYFLEDFPNVYNMLKFLNASYSFRLYAAYGHFNHTTMKYYGMIKDLSQGIGDISGCTMFMSEERRQAIELLTKSSTWGTKIILKKPSMSYVENIYLMTFTARVWFAALLILIIFSITFYISANWHVLFKANTKLKLDQTYTVSDAALLSFEALCQQGTLINSGSYSGKILLFSLFTAFMFLYSAYSGYILVLLQSTTPIKSVRHLVDSRLDCGGINVSFIMAWYQVNQDPALRDLYTKKLRFNQYLTLENGLARVKRGNFAFHTILSVAYNQIAKTFTNYDICKLQELPGHMNTQQYFVAAKSSQYKQLFKVGLLRVAELGLTLRNKDRLASKPKCYNEGGNFQSIGIFDCYTIFYLFIIGIFLSILVLILELALRNYFEKKRLGVIRTAF